MKNSVDGMSTVEVGTTILFLRREFGLSQEQLAFEAGVSVGRLRDIEHGTANYTRDTLYAIASALEVPVWLLYILFLDEGIILALIHHVRNRLVCPYGRWR